MKRRHFTKLLFALPFVALVAKALDPHDYSWLKIDADTPEGQTKAQEWIDWHITHWKRHNITVTPSGVCPPSIVARRGTLTVSGLYFDASRASGDFDCVILAYPPGHS